MAAAISSAGQVQELIAIARRRVWGVFLPAVLTGALGVMAGSLLPAKYSAETVMELGVVPDALSDAGLDQNRLRDEMRAAEFNLSSFSRMDEILSGLEWEHYDMLPLDERREFVRKLLLDMWIKVENLPGTGVHIMKFGYRDTDPQRAAQFANYIRDHFVDDLIQDVTEKATAELGRLNKEYEASDEEYVNADSRLQDLKKEHGISPTQSFVGPVRDVEQDPMYAQLQEELTRDARIEKELEQAEVELETLKARRAQMPLEIPQSATEIGGIELSAAIEELRERINDARILQQGKKQAHSEWQRAQRQIEQFEEQIAALEGRTVDPRLVVNNVPNLEIPIVDAKIGDFEQDVLRLKAEQGIVRRRIEELKPKVDNRITVYGELKRASDTLELVRLRRQGAYVKREIQRNMVDSLTMPNFTPFEVSQVALPPIKPSSPSPLIIVAAGLVLGIGIGVVYALVSEFGRNGFRGPNDLARGLPAPVLGAINEIVTVRDRRQRAFRTGLVGAATLILSASILWVTWAFHSRPGLLGPQLTSWLDGVRGTLR